ncbi:MAG: hypothetical protein JW891_13470 [Candidatus Lokiarchaeota archaeon]|nr:hypothetical protein [Candidatus Lokiarchaeota archaeon]
MTRNILELEYKLDGNVEKSISTNQINFDGKLWTKIAKCEIKLRTSGFRKHRSLFFIVIFSILGAWAFIFAPMIFDYLMPQIMMIEGIAEIYLIAIGSIIESLLMMFFLILLIYPLNVVYRKTEAGFKEIILAAPISESDVFLGEYIGKLPIYFSAILLFVPIIIGLINPIVDLNLIQYLVIYGSVFGLVILGNLIGTVLASLIERKIAKSEKARDLGKALIMVLTIIMVVMMYSLMFFLDFLMSNPELKNWLMFYPSTWYSNIILYVIDRSLINTYVLNIWLSIAIAVIIPPLLLFISYKKAELFYSLEASDGTGQTIVLKENMFYRFVRILTGKKWGALVSVQFKRLLRNKSNIARIGYCVGILGFLTWILSITTEDYSGVRFALMMSVAMAGMIISMMIGHLVFMGSKDVLWIYKRSPRGIGGAVYSFIIALFVFSCIAVIPMTMLNIIFYKLQWIDIVFYSASFLLYTIISLFQAIGIQGLNPAFEEKDKNMQGNMMISSLLQMLPLMTTIMALIFFEISLPAEYEGFVLMGFLFLINLTLTIPIFIGGMRNLKKIE